MYIEEEETENFVIAIATPVVSIPFVLVLLFLFFSSTAAAAAAGSSSTVAV